MVRHQRRRRLALQGRPAGRRSSRCTAWPTTGSTASPRRRTARCGSAPGPAPTRSIPRAASSRTYVRELVNEWVYGLGVDAKDRVWFGTEGGVSMFDGKTLAQLDPPGRPGRAQRRPARVQHQHRPGHALAPRPGDDERRLADLQPELHLRDPRRADGTVWAGTWGGGVGALRRRAAGPTSPTKDGLAGNIVYSHRAGKPTARSGSAPTAGCPRWDGKFQNLGREEGLLEDERVRARGHAAGRGLGRHPTRRHRMARVAADYEKRKDNACSSDTNPSPCWLIAIAGASPAPTRSASASGDGAAPPRQCRSAARGAAPPTAANTQAPRGTPAAAGGARRGKVRRSIPKPSSRTSASATAT